jgi:hypothetical protein
MMKELPTFEHSVLIRCDSEIELLAESLGYHDQLVSSIHEMGGGDARREFPFECLDSSPAQGGWVCSIQPVYWLLFISGRFGWWFLLRARGKLLEETKTLRRTKLEPRYIFEEATCGYLS